jgi:DNA replication protein DnaC
VLTGGQGCGKSVAAAWAVATHEDPTVWVHALELERVFAAQFGDEIKQQERVCGARLLVLDDIGIEKDPAAMCQTLYRLLEARRQRRTIVTTNLSEAKWLERYCEPRLVSRFRELAVFFVDRGLDLRGGGR